MGMSGHPRRLSLEPESRLTFRAWQAKDLENYAVLTNVDPRKKVGSRIDHGRGARKKGSQWVGNIAAAPVDTTWSYSRLTRSVSPKGAVLRVSVTQSTGYSGASGYEWQHKSVR